MYCIVFFGKLISLIDWGVAMKHNLFDAIVNQNFLLFLVDRFNTSTQVLNSKSVNKSLLPKYCNLSQSRLHETIGVTQHL